MKRAYESAYVPSGRLCLFGWRLICLIAFGIRVILAFFLPFLRSDRLRHLALWKLVLEFVEMLQRLDETFDYLLWTKGIQRLVEVVEILSSSLHIHRNVHLIVGQISIHKAIRLFTCDDLSRGKFLLQI